MKLVLRAAAALLAVVAIQAGCIQAEETSILYPDGSGRVTFRIGVRKSMLKLMQDAARRQGDPGAPQTLDDLITVDKYAELSEGVVAWAAARPEEDAQWIRLTIIGYFEDINKVKIHDTSLTPGGEEQKVLSYAWTYERRGTGGKLSLVPGAKDISKKLDRLQAPRRDPFSRAAQELETLKPLLDDFKVSLSLTVPGPVREFGGFFEKNDRTVSLKIDGSAILGVAADQEGADARRLRGISGAFATWADSAVADGELQAFKKEMAAAKEAWARRKGAPPTVTRPAPAAKKKSLADDADRFSDDEVNRAFIRAQIKTAKVYLNGDKKQQAREILESVIKDYGKYSETEEARTLLESLKK